MKRKLVTYILAAACTVAALSCEKAEEDFFVDSSVEREVFLTASMGMDTRAVSVSSEAIAASWQEGDELQLVRDGAVVTTLKVTSIFGQKAMLSGKVKGAYPAGTSFDLYYGGTSYMYAGQMGTASSAAIRGYLKAENVTIASQDNKTLTLSAATLQHQQAYYELSFQYGPDKLKVKRVEITGSDKIVMSKALDGTTEFFSDTNPFVVAASGAEGAEVVYFAMRDEKTESFNYTFKVYPVGSDTPYEAEWKWEGENGVSNPLSKTGPAVNGTYNAGTWVLNRQSTNANVPQAISVVWDGQPHELVTVNALTYGAGSTEAEGAKMLFYVAPVQAADATPDADAVAALAPGDNATWSTEIPVATEPGQYFIWYKVIGGRYFEDIPATLVKESGAVTEIDPTDNRSRIDKRRLNVTAPTGIANLKYTGSAQALINAGLVKDNDSEEFDPGLPMKYFFGPEATTAASDNPDDWSTTLPQATNAGVYKVWFKVDGNEHYYGVAPLADPISVTIATSDAVIANPEPIVNLIYNGEYQQLVLPADASDGCKVYYYVATSNLTREAVVALDNSVWVAPADLESTDPLYEQFVPAPKKRDAGTYYIWTKVVDVSANGAAGNYSGVPGISEAAVVAEIAPIAITVTAYPQTNWTYDGDARALMTQWMTVTYVSKTSATDNALDEPTPAKLYYKFPGETSFTLFTPASPQDIATKTDAGSYTVQYYVDGAPNFESYKSASDPASFTVTVAQAPVVITGVTGVPDLVYSGSDQVLLSAGGTIQFASTHPSKAGETIPGSTGASIHYRWDRANIGGGGIASSSVDNELTPYTNVKGNHAGVYTVYYKVVGGNNYISTSYNDTYKLDVTIAKAQMTSFAVDITGWTYGESANAPSVTGNAGGGSVSYSYKVQGADDGTYSGTAPTNAGNYTVRAIAAATDDYESATAYKDFTIAKADPTLGSITVNPAVLVYDDTDKALITAAAEPTGGTISGYGYYRSDATTASPVQPDTWYALADFKGHDAGYYYIFIKVTGDDNHNDKVFGPIDGSPKQIAQATGSVTLDVSSLHFAITDDVNSTKTITVTAHAGALTCGVSCAGGSTDQISVEESTGTTFTVTRKSSLAHDGTLQVLIIVSDPNYTQVQEEVTVTMDALPPLARVTLDEIGCFIGTDGNVYEANPTLPDGVSLVAMIAYVGSNANCNHGVAISLADGVSGSWSDDATSWATGHVISNTPSGSAWRVPTQDDIEKMYTACNPSLSTTSLNSLLKAGNADYGFTEATWYWTSTEDGGLATIFKEIGDSSRPGWATNSTTASNTFRYVFAF